VTQIDILGRVKEIFRVRRKKKITEGLDGNFNISYLVTSDVFYFVNDYRRRHHIRSVAALEYSSDRS
jgi:hypothetical protein